MAKITITCPYSCGETLVVDDSEHLYGTASFFDTASADVTITGPSMAHMQAHMQAAWNDPGSAERKAVIEMVTSRIEMYCGILRQMLGVTS